MAPKSHAPRWTAWHSTVRRGARGAPLPALPPDKAVPLGTRRHNTPLSVADIMEEFTCSFPSSSSISMASSRLAALEKEVLTLRNANANLRSLAVAPRTLFLPRAGGAGQLFGGNLRSSFRE